MLLAWGAGQAALALAFVGAFALLHEAGHGALFPSPAANAAVGRACALLQGIPWTAWRRVHAAHHRWAGWQDRDPTTAPLARDPGRLARALLDVAWWTGLPLCALLYRRPYWDLARLAAEHPRDRRALRLEAASGALLSLAALGLLALVPARLALLVAPGLWLGLWLQEALLLSQHTHLPLPRAGDQDVRPLTARDQARYSRSLRLPAWLSWLWLGVDAHAEHHAAPSVPGDRLRALAPDLLPSPTPRELPWLAWLARSRALRGSALLFSHVDATGAPL